MSDGLGRAKADLDEGRLWKARDRLQGLLGSHPAGGDAATMLGALAVSTPMRTWPADVQDRLASLQKQAAESGYRWGPGEVRLQGPYARAKTTVAVALLLTLLGLATVGVWLLGLAAIGWLISRAV